MCVKWLDIQRYLCAVVFCLDRCQRELVRKCVIEGWSYAEIAAHEGKDKSAVRHVVKRALKKIKKYFILTVRFCIFLWLISEDSSKCPRSS